MAKVRVRMNNAAARALLRGDEISADIQGRVDSVAEACGEGYEADVQVGRNRVHGMVKTTSFEAMRDNQRNNTILKNLDRGR